MNPELNAPNTTRNLTLERQIAHLERQKRDALAPISAIETVVMPLVKRNPKTGEVILDSDGVPVIVDKRVLKRTAIAQEHDDRIAKFKATGCIE
jgi:uncharacterized metal-binding protein